MGSLAKIGKGYTFANITYHNEFPVSWCADCPHCGRRVAWGAPRGSLAIAKCRHCQRQFPACDGQVVEPGPCDHACRYVEPFGFVPEAGCPIHDLVNADG